MQRPFHVCQFIDTDSNGFVDFWARLYKDKNEHLYTSNITTKPFTDNSIMDLFVWKNGGKLSESKRISVKENYVSKREAESVGQAIMFPRDAKDEEADMFAGQFLNNDFQEGGEIWRIFWLHCCNQRFPIYDQHVHRAMVLIQEGRIEELDEFENRKINLYLSKYLLFHRRFSGDHRRIDMALHTFGRFIKAWPDLCQSNAGRGRIAMPLT